MTIEQLLPGIKRNIPLKNYTTFRIGGPAKYFFVAKAKEELIKAILVAKKFNLPFFILAGGSNILVSDKGFNGLVIKCQMSNVKCQMSRIFCEAGTPLAKLVSKSSRIGATGLEWATGIPGTVGGAIRGNAGAFGESMADIVKSVEVFDGKDLRFKIYDLRECKFSYRDSIFKKNPNLIILSTTLRLKKENKKTIQRKMKECLNYRKETQPLNFPSAGSIFRNHQLSYELVKRFPELKKFNKQRLIPAGWLIEKCGLKGKRIGQVQISERHANFIVNLGNGKAKDVKKLINLTKQEVKSKFGISLEEEIQYLS